MKSIVDNNDIQPKVLIASRKKKENKSEYWCVSSALKRDSRWAWKLIQSFDWFCYEFVILTNSNSIPCTKNPNKQKKTKHNCSDSFCRCSLQKHQTFGCIHLIQHSSYTPCTSASTLTHDTCTCACPWRAELWRNVQKD